MQFCIMNETNTVTSSDLSDNRESRDDTEASVCWRRPDVTGQKLRTFEDFALVWTFNKFYHEINTVYSSPHEIGKTSHVQWESR